MVSNGRAGSTPAPSTISKEKDINLSLFILYYLVMETEKLIKELLNKSKEEIELIILSLLYDNKLDYTSISNQYIKYLELLKNDNKDKLSEASACILLSFDKDNNDTNYTQRRLYFLNEINKNFNTEKLNRKYNYDKIIGKNNSFYRKNK